MTQEELRKILASHDKWLKNEVDGECANLSYANLSHAKLSYANLSHANLRDASLCDADLRDANLCGADLRDANLRDAKLCDADLRDANLRGANLSYTDLHGADLSYANLRGAKLRGAKLSYADLRDADLRCVDLTHAVYTDTILNLQCPEEGSFIAWKKLSYDAIAKLLIPEDAKRSSATTRKCRASKATVLAIYDKNGEPIGEGYSQQDGAFIYRVVETVYPDRWDENRWNECSNGIHFFMTRKEAEEY